MTNDFRLVTVIIDEIERFLEDSGEPFTPDQLDLLLEARDVMAGGVA